MDKAQYIWMDGKLVAWDDAKIHILTHTLHYGNGVFEGTRAYMTDEGLFFPLDTAPQEMITIATIKSDTIFFITINLYFKSK